MQRTNHYNVCTDIDRPSITHDCVFTDRDEASLYEQPLISGELEQMGHRAIKTEIWHSMWIRLARADLCWCAYMRIQAFSRFPVHARRLHGSVMREIGLIWKVILKEWPRILVPSSYLYRSFSLSLSSFPGSASKSLKLSAYLTI